MGSGASLRSDSALETRRALRSSLAEARAMIGLMLPFRLIQWGAVWAKARRLMAGHPDRSSQALNATQPPWGSSRLPVN
jgi:hypothetical protein